MINWRLGSTKPGWPSSIVFMTPLTIFIVHICGSSCKSPSMSHNTPRILWSALRDNSMLISHPFHSQVRELTHTLQFYAAPLPWETFLHHEPMPRGYRSPPVVTIRRCAVFVYWEESLVFSRKGYFPCNIRTIFRERSFLYLFSRDGAGLHPAQGARSGSGTAF